MNRPSFPFSRSQLNLKFSMLSLAAIISVCCIVPATAAPSGTVIIDGYRASFEVLVKDKAVKVREIGSDQSQDYYGVTQLEFVDRILVVGDAANAAPVYRLYQAAFGRTPDPQGLGYWVKAFQNGVSLENIATGFMQSPEFEDLYGAADTEGFLRRVYSNVLHREPDAGGLAWWVDSFERGNTRLAALLAFSESSENKQNFTAATLNGFDYIPYRQLADHVKIAMSALTTGPVDTHTTVVVGIDQLQPDLLVYTSAYWDFSRTGSDRFRAGPQQLIKWNGSRFEDASSLVAGGIPMMYAAEIAGAVADINNDGVRDVVLGGNGPDGEGVKSEPSFVLLSRASGYDRVALPNAALQTDAYSFAHGLTTVQRRGRSTRSIFLGDFVYGPSAMYDVSPLGDVRLTTDILPDFVGQKTSLSWGGSGSDTGVTAALGADLDGDGADELVIGTLFQWVAEHTKPELNTLNSFILKQSDDGKFTSEIFPLPNGPFPKRDCYQRIPCGSLTVKKIAAANLNGDSLLDLIIDHHIYGTEADGTGYGGSYPQLLANRGGLAFEDVTAEMFGQEMGNARQPQVHTFPFDLNGDGCTDIVMRGDANNLMQPRVFLSNCKGKFVEFTQEFLKLIPKIGVHEQMYGGVPVTLSGRPAILLWSGTGTYDSNLHVIQFMTKIPTPTGAAVIF